MIKAVLDANVFISGLISRSGPPGQLIDRWLANQFALALSSDILDELKRVVEYPHLKARIEPQRAESLFISLAHLAEQTPGELSIPRLKIDPSDTIYFICAIESKSDFLVTGNRSHFTEFEKDYPSLKLVSPREFLETIKEQHGEML